MLQTEITHYLNRQTLIVGDVNSGKSTKTKSILDTLIALGYGPKIVVLDLSPAPVGTIGGKLAVQQDDNTVLYLTTDIVAPRLMGKNVQDTERLASENALKIEKLLGEVAASGRDILFVNDATLYLQAGSLGVFQKTLETTSTQVINAYYGKHFADSLLSRLERETTERLMESCDEVIRL